MRNKKNFSPKQPIMRNMSMTLICTGCNKPFSDRITTGKKIKYYKNRKFCYTCKPVAAQQRNPVDITTCNTQCTFCEKPLKLNSQKPICDGCKGRIKRLRNKIRAIIYKGCKCQECGRSSDLHTDLECFDFHHHIGEKNFEINQVLQGSWENLKKELDLCVMLCAWCHRISHAKTINQNVWDEVTKNIEMP